MPVPKSEVSQTRRLIPARDVATRYGVHLRSIVRWVAMGVIPRPDQIINRRNYWWIDTLDAADRARTVEAAKGTPARHHGSNAAL
ncbi:hypothetical protein GA0061099_1001973 [Bradyrhizobium yuanmingense]|uniref:MerR family transcriptional regulator n=1 Tax=Bradyrhizobium yuanmingense TaxID=108015 RepID=A0A1C3UD61_9BRAD|nr:hypothetical protein IQ15_06172 [Bradyrhizobium yuanmingense]SCB13402.1 hypothetical protein GA0061099_1001973 [Bradyrhizobium yuanmingense]